MKKSTVGRNIPLMYASFSLSWGRFFIPVLALFYIASQVPLEQFAIIMSAFALFTVLFEIPSGVVADLLGKRKALLFGDFCFIVEIFMIAFFNGFWIFLIAKMISGIGVSLSSGADSSLLFDTLKREKREKEYKKVYGNIMAVANIFGAFVFIIGAYLFTIHYKLPAIVSLPLVILTFILTFFMVEPYPNRKKVNFRNSFAHLRESFAYFKGSHFVKFISFLSFFTGMVLSIMYWLSSAYYEKILIPVALMGVVAFVYSMVTAVTSKKAHSIEKKFGERKSLLLIQVLVLGAVFGMALLIPIYGVLFFALIAIAAAFFKIITNDYIHRHIKSSHRATLISINNLFRNLGVFILFPVVGYLIKSESMSFSFVFLGVVVLVGYIVVWSFSKKWNIVFGK